MGLLALLMSNTVILLAAFTCGKKEKKTKKPQPEDDRMPKSSRTPSTRKTATPSDTPTSSCKRKEVSQASTGMNWTNMNVPSKEEAEKTDLDQNPEENVFVNKKMQQKTASSKKEGSVKHKVNKSKRNVSKRKYKKDKKIAFHGNLHPKPPPAPPIAPTAPHKEKRKDVTQATTGKTEDTGGQTECTMMRTVDHAGQTQCTMMRTVDQTMDCTSMYKANPKSPSPPRNRSKLIEVKELNVEPASNDQQATQYEKVVTQSTIQPTQILPPKAPSLRKEVQDGAIPTKQKDIKKGSRESLKNVPSGTCKKIRQKPETQGTEEESSEERPNSEAGQSCLSPAAPTTTPPSDAINTSKKMDAST